MSSRTKIFCIASYNWNTSRVSPQDFNVRYVMSTKKERRLC